jgi:hypothetical protein
MLEGTAYNPARCTLAYVHDPLFSTSPEVTRKVARIWEALYAAGVEVVLSGDDHNYQRFAPQDPNGEADYERGIRQFVVGTGGKNHYAIESPIENLEVYNNDTFGVLKLSLKEDGYEWRFVPVEGKTFTDARSARCHTLPPIERTQRTVASRELMAESALPIASTKASRVRFAASFSSALILERASLIGLKSAE